MSRRRTQAKLFAGVEPSVMKPFDTALSEMAELHTDVQSDLRAVVERFEQTKPALHKSILSMRSTQESLMGMIQKKLESIQKSEHPHSRKLHSLKKAFGFHKHSHSDRKVQHPVSASNILKEVEELQESLVITEAQYDEAMGKYYFPEALGYRLRSSGGGVHFGMKRLWLEEIEGHFSAAVTPRSSRTSGTDAIISERPHISIQLRGRSGSESTDGFTSASAKHKRKFRLASLGRRFSGSGSHHHGHEGDTPNDSDPAKGHPSAAEGPKGLCARLHATDLMVVGEKGSMIPELFFPALAADVELAVDAIAEYDPDLRHWDLSEKGQRFDIIHLKTKIKGILDAPDGVVSWIIERIVPTLIRFIVNEIVPTELGEYLCSSATDRLRGSKHQVVAEGQFAILGPPRDLLFSDMGTAKEPDVAAFRALLDLSEDATAFLCRFLEAVEARAPKRDPYLHPPGSVSNVHGLCQYFATVFLPAELPTKHVRSDHPESLWRTGRPRQVIATWQRLIAAYTHVSPAFQKRAGNRLILSAEELFARLWRLHRHPLEVHCRISRLELSVRVGGILRVARDIVHRLAVDAPAEAVIQHQRRGMSFISMRKFSREPGKRFFSGGSTDASSHPHNAWYAPTAAALHVLAENLSVLRIRMSGLMTGSHTSKMTRRRLVQDLTPAKHLKEGSASFLGTHVHKTPMAKRREKAKEENASKSAFGWDFEDDMSFEPEDMQPDPGFLVATGDLCEMRGSIKLAISFLRYFMKHFRCKVAIPDTGLLVISLLLPAQSERLHASSSSRPSAEEPDLCREEVKVMEVTLSHLAGDLLVSPSYNVLSQDPHEFVRIPLDAPFFFGPLTSKHVREVCEDASPSRVTTLECSCQRYRMLSRVEELLEWCFDGLIQFLEESTFRDEIVLRQLRLAKAFLLRQMTSEELCTSFKMDVNVRSVSPGSRQRRASSVVSSRRSSPRRSRSRCPSLDNTSETDLATDVAATLDPSSGSVSELRNEQTGSSLSDVPLSSPQPSGVSKRGESGNCSDGSGSDSGVYSGTLGRTDEGTRNVGEGDGENDDSVDGQSEVDSDGSTCAFGHAETYHHDEKDLLLDLKGGPVNIHSSTLLLDVLEHAAELAHAAVAVLKSKQ
eukprot:Rmarinus@m.12475